MWETYLLRRTTNKSTRIQQLIQTVMNRSKITTGAYPLYQIIVAALFFDYSSCFLRQKSYLLVTILCTGSRKTVLRRHFHLPRILKRNNRNNNNKYDNKINKTNNGQLLWQ